MDDFRSIETGQCYLASRNRFVFKQLMRKVLYSCRNITAHNTYSGVVAGNSMMLLLTSLWCCYWHIYDAVMGIFMMLLLAFLWWCFWRLMCGGMYSKQLRRGFSNGGKEPQSSLWSIIYMPVYVYFPARNTLVRTLEARQRWCPPTVFHLGAISGRRRDRTAVCVPICVAYRMHLWLCSGVCLYEWSDLHNVYIGYMFLIMQTTPFGNRLPNVYWVRHAVVAV